MPVSKNGEPLERRFQTEEQFVVAWHAARADLLTWLHARQYSDSAEAILAETFIKAWVHREQYTGRGTSNGWFMRICQNATREYREHESRIPIQPLADTPPVDAYLAEEYSESGEHERVRLENDRLRLLQTRSRRQQIIISLRAHGLPFARIAVAVESSEASVKSLFHQARGWLLEHDPGRHSDAHERGP
jgi:DNA-directed RNA polymerase specialized sigma24 family protein